MAILNFYAGGRRPKARYANERINGLIDAHVVAVLSGDFMHKIIPPIDNIAAIISDNPVILSPPLSRVS